PAVGAELRCKRGMFQMDMLYGNESFASRVTDSSINNPHSVAVADINQDNRLDVVVDNSNNNYVSVLLGRR
ncbi:unnamed protein product, partial [Rotaria sp. Silwood1]